jgi:hypothetical protein
MKMNLLKKIYDCEKALPQSDVRESSGRISELLDDE